jgi:hypothetical protein
MSVPIAATASCHRASHGAALPGYAFPLRATPAAFVLVPVGSDPIQASLEPASVCFIRAFKRLHEMSVMQLFAGPILVLANRIMGQDIDVA